MEAEERIPMLEPLSSQEELEAYRGAPTEEPDVSCLCDGTGIMLHPVHEYYIYCYCRYGKPRKR